MLISPHAQVHGVERDFEATTTFLRDSRAMEAMQ